MELLRFEPEPECPKCGSMGMRCRHHDIHAGCRVNRGKSLAEAVEHICWTCQGCGYEFATATKDAGGSPAGPGDVRITEPRLSTEPRRPIR